MTKARYIPSTFRGDEHPKLGHNYTCGRHPHYLSRVTLDSYRTDKGACKLTVDFPLTVQQVDQFPTPPNAECNLRHIWSYQPHFSQSQHKEAEDLPVSSTVFGASPPSFTSLGMNGFSFVFRHNVGCRRSWKSITASSPSTNVGRHDGSPSAADDFAKLNRQSSSANTRTARSHSARSLSNSAYRRNLKALIAAVRFSCASFSLRTRFWNEPTTKRFLAWAYVNGEI